MKNSKTYIICLLVIVFVAIISIVIKNVFVPVPDKSQIRKMAKEYAEALNSSAVVGEIYRDLYSDEAGMNSWRCDIYCCTNTNAEYKVIIRYHPITGEIISVEDKNVTQ